MHSTQCLCVHMRSGRVDLEGLAYPFVLLTSSHICFVLSSERDKSVNLGQVLNQDDLISRIRTLHGLSGSLVSCLLVSVFVPLCYGRKLLS